MITKSSVKPARPPSTISLLTDQLKYSSLNDPSSSSSIIIHDSPTVLDKILSDGTAPPNSRPYFLSSLSLSSSSSSCSSVFRGAVQQLDSKDSPDQFGLETIDEVRNALLVCPKSNAKRGWIKNDNQSKYHQPHAGSQIHPMSETSSSSVISELDDENNMANWQREKHYASDRFRSEPFSASAPNQQLSDESFSNTVDGCHCSLTVQSAHQPFGSNGTAAIPLNAISNTATLSAWTSHLDSCKCSHQHHLPAKRACRSMSASSTSRRLQSFKNHHHDHCGMNRTQLRLLQSHLNTLPRPMAVRLDHMYPTDKLLSCSTDMIHHFAMPTSSSNRDLTGLDMTLKTDKSNREVKNIEDEDDWVCKNEVILRPKVRTLISLNHSDMRCQNSSKLNGMGQANNCAAALKCAKFGLTNRNGQIANGVVMMNQLKLNQINQSGLSNEMSRFENPINGNSFSAFTPTQTSSRFFANSSGGSSAANSVSSYVPNPAFSFRDHLFVHLSEASSLPDCSQIRTLQFSYPPSSTDEDDRKCCKDVSSSISSKFQSSPIHIQNSTPRHHVISRSRDLYTCTTSQSHSVPTDCVIRCCSQPDENDQHASLTISDSIQANPTATAGLKRRRGPSGECSALVCDLPIPLIVDRTDEEVVNNNNSNNSNNNNNNNNNDITLVRSSRMKRHFENQLDLQINHDECQQLHNASSIGQLQANLSAPASAMFTGRSKENLFTFTMNIVQPCAHFSAEPSELSSEYQPVDDPTWGVSFECEMKPSPTEEFGCRRVMCTELGDLSEVMEDETPETMNAEDVVVNVASQPSAVLEVAFTPIKEDENHDRLAIVEQVDDDDTNGCCADDDSVLNLFYSDESDSDDVRVSRLVGRKLVTCSNDLDVNKRNSTISFIDLDLDLIEKD